MNLYMFIVLIAHSYMWLNVQIKCKTHETRKETLRKPTDSEMKYRVW